MISHLFFVEDLILFEEATKKQSRLMEKILTEFCGMSGQKVNMTNQSYLFHKMSEEVQPELLAKILESL